MTQIDVQRLLATVIAQGWHGGSGSESQIDFDIARAILADPRITVTCSDRVSGMDWKTVRHLKMTNNTEISALITRLYTLPGCSMGGPIHVVVDDDNIEDYFLDWSLYRDSLHANDDPDGPHYIPYSLEAIWLAQEILCGLRAMSMEDRKESMRNATRYPRGSLPWV